MVHQSIPFSLKRSNRRTIGLTVNDGKLQVTAPHWVSQSEIDAAVARSRRWITNRLAEQEQLLDQKRHAENAWAFGQKISYMGQLIMLQPVDVHASITFTGQPDLPAPGDQLRLPLSPDASRQQIQDAGHAWLQTQARWWLEQRLEHFLMLAGKQIETWALSSATTRWGSCSNTRRIRLNWRLIHFSHNLIDYVVAHEVAHLSEMNHSPAFWKVVEALLPDYQLARQQLRNYRPGIMPMPAQTE